MKVTMKKWRNNYGCPALYDVIINGKVIGEGIHSWGRVLKMGNVYLPILDGKQGESLPMFGSFTLRSDAARYVADVAKEKGYFS